MIIGPLDLIREPCLEVASGLDELAEALPLAPGKASLDRGQVAADLVTEVAHHLLRWSGSREARIAERLTIEVSSWTQVGQSWEVNPRGFAPGAWTSMQTDSWSPTAGPHRISERVGQSVGETEDASGRAGDVLSFLSFFRTPSEIEGSGGVSRSSRTFKAASKYPIRLPPTKETKETKERRREW
jgi:hypothetical protein